MQNEPELIRIEPQTEEEREARKRQPALAIKSQEFVEDCVFNIMRIDLTPAEILTLTLKVMKTVQL